MKWFWLSNSNWLVLVSREVQKGQKYITSEEGFCHFSKYIYIYRRLDWKNCNNSYTFLKYFQKKINFVYQLFPFLSNCRAELSLTFWIGLDLAESQVELAGQLSFRSQVEFWRFQTKVTTSKVNRVSKPSTLKKVNIHLMGLLLVFLLFVLATHSNCNYLHHTSWGTRPIRTTHHLPSTLHCSCVLEISLIGYWGLYGKNPRIWPFLMKCPHVLCNTNGSVRTFSFHILEKWNRNPGRGLHGPYLC